ncbi:MAG TPA: biotin/lipoyl-containing protein [Pyrinomonadaceae bacterium]|jgi:biotin carboxyl carrier protein
MKLTAEIDGASLKAQIKIDGSRVFAEIDGRSYEIEARVSAQGIHVLAFEGRIYECRVDAEAAQREAFEVHVGARAFAVALRDEKRLPHGGLSAGTQAGGTARLVAPMPGKVVRVLVEQGAQVLAGDSIVVVEAMKMQNDMKAPRAGTVTTLHAQAGATVKAGEVLAVIE